MRTRRWNVVWVIPILAILIGGWMLYKNFSEKGPTIKIRFATAEGIIAGQTEIKCRSVTVGKVKRVELGKDLDSVILHCTLGAGTEDLLLEGTRFWVVRPRISAANISGLATLITGSYIELDPGTMTEKKRNFRWDGLENPPATNLSVPGRRLTLVSDQAGYLSVGSPIYYRGFEVGRVEESRLDNSKRRIIYQIFIREEYQELVKENTKFWNTSGVDVVAGVDGFKLRTPSFQAMVSGGISFSVPVGMDAGETVGDDTIFELHEDAESAAASTFKPSMQLLLLFDQSVRGLVKTAPVEYRGITIGRVTNISFDYIADRENRKVPVLVEIDPQPLRPNGEEDAPEEEVERLGDAIKNGLRATIKTGSLLTGAMYVDFDYYDDAEPVELTFEDKYPVVPTRASGLLQIEAKLASILEKVDSLPVEEMLKQITRAADETATTVADAKGVIEEVQLVAKAVREALENPELKTLPENLNRSLQALEESLASIGPNGTLQGDLLRSLDEFRSAMRSVEALSDTIKEKPNSIFFGKETSKGVRPKAAGPRR
ncbi:MAG: intermembrane transport protein PqiB [Akkermansiaceae bacterium]